MLSLDSRIIHYGEIRVIGSSDSRPEHVQKAVKMITERTIPVDKLVTHIVDMENILDAFELMQTGRALRVILKI